MTSHSSGAITIGRKELIAKLTLVGLRAAARNPGHMRQSDDSGLSVQRIAAYITECAREFELSNDEQMLMLKFAVCGKETALEMMEGDD